MIGHFDTVLLHGLVLPPNEELVHMDTVVVLNARVCVGVCVCVCMCVPVGLGG